MGTVTVRRYRYDLVTILLGLACLAAVAYVDGILIPILGITFTLGGVLKLLLRRSGSHFRLYTAVGMLQLAIPGLVTLGLGVLHGNRLDLFLGVFFLTLTTMLLLGAASTVETRKLNPFMFLAFAVGMFLIDQLLAALVLVGFTFFTAYTAISDQQTSG